MVHHTNLFCTTHVEAEIVNDGTEMFCPKCGKYNPRFKYSYTISKEIYDRIISCAVKSD